MKLDRTEENMNDSELADKARGVSRCLTYNDDTPQAEAKHLLREMAHRLDASNIRAHKKADGLLLVNAIGAARYATSKERLAYTFFGALPRRL